jgi:hypothetical protein
MSAESIRALKAAAKDKKDNPPKKKFYRLPQRTKKQAKTVRKLRKKYDAYLEKNPVCAIQSPVCTYHAGTVNHKAGRGENEVLDESTWEPSCYPCNGYVETHDEWAQQNGHKISRHAKRDQ